MARATPTRPWRAWDAAAWVLALWCSADAVHGGAGRGSTVGERLDNITNAAHAVAHTAARDAHALAGEAADDAKSLASGAAEALGFPSESSPKANMSASELKAVVEAAHDFEKEDEACGISGRLGASGYVEFKKGDHHTECHRPLSTNCSVSYRTIVCPDECPFIAPSSTFPCLLTCVDRNSCSAANPNLALPDEEALLCRPCGIVNCRNCLSRETCAECYDGFLLTADASKCAFGLERQIFLREVLVIIFIALVALVLLAFLWRWRKGPPQWARLNNLSIHRAMRHRHMTKVQRWSLKEGKARERYPLNVNVHEKHLMGEGLALFYNSLGFLMVIGCLFWATTYTVYRLSDAEKVLGQIAAFSFLSAYQQSLVEHAMSVPDDAPAMVVSPLATCGDSSSSDVAAAMDRFADYSYYGCGFLYIATFLVSLYHGLLQRSKSEAYRAKNSTMSDYVVCLKNLPPEATDEPEMKAWLQDEVLRAFGKTSVSPDIEVHGVSIGYDYTKLTDEVDAMITRLVESAEVEMDFYSEEQTTTACEVPSRSMEEAEKKDQQTARAWFSEGKDRLFSSGEIFLVFKHKASAHQFLRIFEAGERKLFHPSKPTTPIEVCEVRVEPVSACWWHFGINGWQLCRRISQAILKMIGMLLAVQILLVLPFVRYIVMPYVSGGNPAGGRMFVVAGFLLGWVNMLTCIQIYFISYGLGFHRKDRRDAVIFWANFVLTFANNVLPIATTVMQVFGQSSEMLSINDLFQVRSLVRTAKEHAIAHDICLMLLPGMFFTGYLMCPIMAGLVPYLWNMLLMKVIYVWHCLPAPLLGVLRLFLPWAPQSIHRYPVRLAEKGLEGMELGLPWDYANIIMFPAICFTLLAIASPFVWQVFRGLFFWGVFYYVYCRYMHLRFMRAQYYTTSRVDRMVNIAWGLPLSIVAVAWCVWGMRTGRLPGSDAQVWQKYLIIIMSFVGSFALWVFVYCSVVPFGGYSEIVDWEDPPVEDVKKSTLYSWFNCNPIYTLKCKHVVQHLDAEAQARFTNPMANGSEDNVVRFFEVGKEYLFLPKHKQEDIELEQDDHLEFETYLDWMVRWLEGERQSPIDLTLRLNSPVALPGLRVSSTPTFRASCPPLNNASSYALVHQDDQGAGDASKS